MAGPVLVFPAAPSPEVERGRPAADPLVSRSESAPCGADGLTPWSVTGVLSRLGEGKSEGSSPVNIFKSFFK